MLTLTSSWRGTSVTTITRGEFRVGKRGGDGGTGRWIGEVAQTGPQAGREPGAVTLSAVGRARRAVSPR